MPQLEITKELYAQISESAKRAGLSINQYLENRILDNPPIKPLTTLSSDNLASTQLNEKQNHTKQMLFLQAILDMLHVQLAVLDEVGVIVYVNKAWIDFPLGNGESPETETVGTNYLEVCENALGDDSKVAHSFAAGIRAVISGEQSTFSLEYPCHSPTEQRWFLGHVFAMPDNQEGKALIIHQDITTRKLLEIEARTNEIRYRAIFENFPNGMVALYDEDLRYTMADGEGLAQVGMTNADLVGNTFAKIASSRKGHSQ